MPFVVISHYLNIINNRCEEVCKNPIFLHCSNGHLFCKLCMVSYIDKYNSNNINNDKNSKHNINNNDNICPECPIDNELNKQFEKSYFASLRIANFIISCPTLFDPNKFSFVCKINSFFCKFS